jgi:hypothetical protein
MGSALVVDQTWFFLEPLPHSFNLHLVIFTDALTSELAIVVNIFRPLTNDQKDVVEIPCEKRSCKTVDRLGFWPGGQVVPTRRIQRFAQVRSSNLKVGFGCHFELS